MRCDIVISLAYSDFEKVCRNLSGNALSFVNRLFITSTGTRNRHIHIYINDYNYPTSDPDMIELESGVRKYRHKFQRICGNNVETNGVSCEEFDDAPVPITRFDGFKGRTTRVNEVLGIR